MLREAEGTFVPLSVVLLVMLMLAGVLGMQATVDQTLVPRFGHPGLADIEALQSLQVAAVKLRAPVAAAAVAASAAASGLARAAGIGSSSAAASAPAAVPVPAPQAAPRPLKKASRPHARGVHQEKRERAKDPSRKNSEKDAVPKNTKLSKDAER